MNTPALDRDRLLRDLRAAAFEIDQPWTVDEEPEVFELQGMARAWRVLAAAIEDGEYDAGPDDEPIGYAMSAGVLRRMRERKRREDEAR